MLPVTAFLIVGVLLFLYIVGSSIEFGSSLLVLFPRLLDDKKAVARYFGPIWEATHVLLIFAVVAVFTCFPKAIASLSVPLTPIIDTAIVFFGLRVIAILALFYAKLDGLFWRILFVVGSFGAPITLSIAYIYFITGTVAPNETFFLLVGLLVLVPSIIAMISSTFFLYFVGGNTPTRTLSRLASDAAHLFLAGALVFMLGLMYEAAHLFVQSNLILVALFGAAIPSLLIRYFHGVRYWGSAFITAVIGVFAFFLSLAIAHIPFLVFPTITLADAFTSPEIFIIMLYTLGGGAVVLIPSFVLLYSLFARPRALLITRS